MKSALRVASMFGLVTACARPVDHTPPPSRPVSLGTVGVAPGAPRLPWSKKSFEQRMEFMGLTFHPRMKELFQAYDAASYGKFRCRTCHGEDMEARRFAMPASLRPVSDGAHGDGGARDPKAFEFMVSKVLPSTRELLSDEGDGAKIGCDICHARQ